jgi:hypothetical protein
MVELTAPHFIDGRVWPIEARLDVAVVTPLMLPLDDEAAVAIRAEKIRVFGRWIWDPDRGWYLLDDPPIERPLGDNQPVPPLGGEGGPGR